MTYPTNFDRTGIQKSRVFACILSVATLPLFLVGCFAPCSIERVEWRPIPGGEKNLQLGGNPKLMGGGDRIFPCRNEPGGKLNDRLVVRAIIGNRKFNKPIAVHFMLIDEDHYSSDPDFDPNDTSKGDDNVEAGEPVIIDIGAKLMKANFSGEYEPVILPVRLPLDLPGGIAEVGLQITHIQPGNNWRVAAICEEIKTEIQEGPEGEPHSTFTLHPPSAESFDHAHKSPLLTVWRRLFVERDRMSFPVLNAGPGQSKFDGGNAAKTGPNRVRLTLGVGKAIVGTQGDQFQGGSIELLRSDSTSLGLFDVRRNTTGGTPIITTVQVVPDETAKFKNLVDDDINNKGPNKVDTSEKMIPDVGFWKSRLEPALVVPVFDNPAVASKNSVAAFDVHVGDSDDAEEEADAVKALIKANKASKSEPGFWVVYQLGAFQGRMDEDVDPDPSEPTLGISSMATNPKDDSEAGTIIYAEAIRDLSSNPTVTTSAANLKRLTSIHEIGHEFGMRDGGLHGPLMNANDDYFHAKTESQLRDLKWSGKGLQKIMLTRQPGGG